ncbi:hypothetical protein [Endozoicomonas sp. 4G]|uniref:hypothetical protein n=1 Tax=Endozoicomonas sp. 4G TaxID=2872754 RepID=UPI002078B94B|nr:hypothetical protein [Endozoicomonas sp. 4G]
MNKHHVMSATYNDSVYYLANIEIDSRRPFDAGSSSAKTATESPGPSPTIPTYMPAGILDLRGAGIFVADNIKVVLNPEDNQEDVKPVQLGCTDYADGRGAEINFVYRFTHSEFDLKLGLQKPTDRKKAALNVDCYQQTGQVQLTLKNTKTVLKVPEVREIPRSTESSGVLFSLNLFPRENVLHLVDSTCNSIVDQLGNDLAVDFKNPLDLDHYMGGAVGSTFCSDIKTVQGAFGLKDWDEAWGLVIVKHTYLHSCSSMVAKRYQLWFAPVSEWSATGVDDVACRCLPTCTPSMSPTSCKVPSYTTAQAPSADALVINSTQGLTKEHKIGMGIGIGVLMDQLITQSWFHLSKRIRQARIRYVNQALAATLGFGLPAVQLIPGCISGLRGRGAGHSLLTNQIPDSAVDPAQP